MKSFLCAVSLLAPVAGAPVHQAAGRLFVTDGLGNVSHLRRCDLGDVRRGSAFYLDDCTELDLVDYDLDDRDVMELARALLGPSDVSLVDLSNNLRITDAGALALAEMLRHNHNLATLELYACGVGNAGAAALLEGIADNPASAIVDMDLRGNPVTSAAAHGFGEFARLRSGRPIALHPFSDEHRQAAARSD